jgi:transposase
MVVQLERPRTEVVAVNPAVNASRGSPPARTFMGFTGLVPSEYSSGERVCRGRITKAGNAHLRT